MTGLGTVCVFSGSSPGARPSYVAAATALGREIAQRGMRVVYGGASVGLMGAVADAALAAGGEVVGVIPQHLVDREVAHTGLTELRVTTSMHERKALMADLSDGFVALPGGLGTLEELAEVLTWSQLGLQSKPCGLLDVEDFFAPLLAFLDHTVTERFVSPEHRSLVLSADRPAVLLDRLAGWRPDRSVSKWRDRSGIFVESFSTLKGMTQTLALPSFEDATVVVPAPGSEPGNWSGAASAVLVDGVYWLTYRVRRPLREGRGVSVVVARSEDGEHFVTVAEVRRDEFGAESFERPVLVRRPDGGWRLYVSCATPDSKHWWIEAVDADQPADLEDGVRTVVLPGSDEIAVKDPVVLVDETGWRMWVCVHPLADAGHEDRMTTAFATSADGLVWHWHGTVLAPTAGTWDQRGTRVTAVLAETPLVVLYDGRARAEDNWHEGTGVARSDDGRTLVAEDLPAIRSPHSDGALRYVAAVPLPDGRTRFYFEAARPDGAHDLMTSIGG